MASVVGRESQLSCQKVQDEFPEQVAWNGSGAKFQQGLKPGVLKVSVLGSERAWRTLGLLLEKGRDR